MTIYVDETTVRLKDGKLRTYWNADDSKIFRGYSVERLKIQKNWSGDPILTIRRFEIELPEPVETINVQCDETPADEEDFIEDETEQARRLVG